MANNRGKGIIILGLSPIILGAILGALWGVINLFPEGVEGILDPAGRFPPFPIDIPQRILNVLVGGWYSSWLGSLSGDISILRLDVFLVPIALMLATILVGVVLGALIGGLFVIPLLAGLLGVGRRG